MTNEEINAVASAVGKLLEPRLSHIEALVSETNSISRGTTIQMAIIFDKIGAIEDEMIKLTARVAALEPKKSNGHAI